MFALFWRANRQFFIKDIGGLSYLIIAHVGIYAISVKVDAMANDRLEHRLG